MRINHAAAFSFGIPLVFLIALLFFRGSLAPFQPDVENQRPQAIAPEPALPREVREQPRSPPDIAGNASVIDGDTIVIHGIHIRLNGIDAPESGQLCETEGKRYLCGQKAAFALSDFLGSKTVKCQDLGRDLYRRTIGRCMVDNTDIQRWIVQQGWAVAYRKYSKDYIADEEQAHNAKLGIWAGTFMMPEEWRRQKRNHTLDPAETKPRR